ncbi:hypothetical protein PISMIDRAFT_420886 [Pisolithus microcarpus 441]|uniref:Uncharacterized protein n=1 Tax=Pisolithus microcarpus 441 TaxID=765257 RepID=A0A0C9YGI4_9AGAM|nr:hypothetical protein BKA83DRAFT_420886 [Pisolithus microcarpus]KIK24015.1 hypothetical protein PISMIDRAFT_420886 [Pisolithus microcarpus 441]
MPKCRLVEEARGNLTVFLDRTVNGRLREREQEAVAYEEHSPRISTLSTYLYEMRQTHVSYITLGYCLLWHCFMYFYLTLSCPLAAMTSFRGQGTRFTQTSASMC